VFGQGSVYLMSTIMNSGYVTMKSGKREMVLSTVLRANDRKDTLRKPAVASRLRQSVTNRIVVG
jgi:hypothetical protein